MAKKRIVTPGTQIKFNCGDIVAREGDEKHEGVVVAILGNDARVSWFDLNGAKQDVDQDELVLLRHRRPATPAWTRRRPSTVVESPRAKLERWMRERAGLED